MKNYIQNMGNWKKIMIISKKARPHFLSPQQIPATKAEVQS